MYFRQYDEDPDKAMEQCQILLEEPDLDNAVRIGDVYGMMIEHFARQDLHKKVNNTFPCSRREQMIDPKYHK